MLFLKDYIKYFYSLLCKMKLIIKKHQLNKILIKFIFLYKSINET
jgi:hypothetical protein